MECDAHDEPGSSVLPRSCKLRLEMTVISEGDVDPPQRVLVLVRERRTHHIPYSLAHVRSPRVVFTYLCDRGCPLTCLLFVGVR